jgi:hypothetical protein
VERRSVKVQSYSVTKGENGWKAAIWGIDGTVVAPLVYLRRPKWMPIEDFNRIVDGIKVEMMPFEVKESK